MTRSPNPPDLWDSETCSICGDLILCEQPITTLDRGETCHADCHAVLRLALAESTEKPNDGSIRV